MTQVLPSTVPRLPLAHNHTHSGSHPYDCVCTVCTCGSHRCPPTPSHGHYDPNLRSSYMTDYKGETVPLHRPPPRNFVHRNLPFDATTTNRHDFPWHPAQPKNVGSRDFQLHTEGLPFNGSTTNQDDFRAWPVGPARAATAREYRPRGPDDRDFKTESSANFCNGPQARRESCAPLQRALDTLPFEGQSTNNADFRDWTGARPARSVRRPNHYRPRSDTRDFNTEMRGNFGPKAFDPCPSKTLARPTKPAPGHMIVEQDQRGQWRHTGRTTGQQVMANA